MTDKEFKRLNKAQLLDIIYQLQLQVDTLTEKNQSLEQALEDKRLRISNAGNLAEAALEINNCFRSAQAAADQYVSEIKNLYEAAEAERERILAEARTEAEAILSGAKWEYSHYDSVVKSILEQYEQHHSDNGDSV